MTVLYLEPPPIPTSLEDFKSSGRTISHTLSPRTGLSLWVSPTSTQWTPWNSHLQSLIWFTSFSSSDPLLSKFYKDTYEVFHTAQALHQSHIAQGTAVDVHTRHLREIAEHYTDAIEGIVRDGENAASVRAHHLDVLSVFSLAAVLYLPQDGHGDSLLGEELLDWANSYGDGQGMGELCDSAKSLLKSLREWEMEDWLNVVNMAILRAPTIGLTLLQSVAGSHPETQVREFTQILHDALEVLPRSFNYPTTVAFLQAYSEWRDDLQNVTSLYIRGRSTWVEFEGNNGDRSEAAAWQDVLSGFAQIMMGDQDTILQACADAELDWTVVVGIWGVWCDPELRRDWVSGGDGLATAVDIITTSIPPPDSPASDPLQSLLCNDLVHALTTSLDLSLWLSTHLCDLLEKIDLVMDDSPDYEVPLRDYFIMQYVEQVLSEEEWWEVKCSYLAGCGSQGVGRIGQVIRRVGLKLDQGVDRVNQLFKTASDLGLEDERKEICRLAAIGLAEEGKFGLALVYCAHAGDERLSNVIGDKVLDVYCQKGIEAYQSTLSQVPTTLYTESTSPKSPLPFLARYSQFHTFLQQDEKKLAAQVIVECLIEGVVPDRFLGVLLLDCVGLLEDEEILLDEDETIEVIRNLEIVHARERRSPGHYLKRLWEMSACQRLPGQSIQVSSEDMDMNMEEDGTHQLSKESRDKQRLRQDKEMRDAAKALDVVRLAASRNLTRAGLL